MSLRRYLLIMTAMTALCWVAFGYIVWTVDPETTNGTGFFLFYLSLFLALAGAAALAGFLIRFVFLRHQLLSHSVIAAFRQSFMFSGFLIALLILLSRSLLSWLNAGLLIVGLSALEFFLLRYFSAIPAPPPAGGEDSGRAWQ